MYRLTYALINNDILEENVKNIKKKYNNFKYYIGVVKNNAYNHGIHIIPSLIRGGINYLATSSLEEAMEIRKYYLDIPILILEPISIKYVDVACKNNITISIESLNYVKELVKLNLKNELKVHLKIDTGLNRLGFKEKEDINEAVKILSNSDNIFLEGVFTHFGTSGFIDPYYDKQVDKIYELLSDIDLKKIPIIHFDRSISLIRHEKLDMATGVRLGIIMYGYNSVVKYSTSLKDYLRMKKREMYLKKHHISNSILENDLKVKPAFSLYSNVLSIRMAKKGEYVSYDAKYICKEDTILATIPIGYADGVNKNYKYVYINDKKYEIICDYMDMIMVKVDKSVKIGDSVEIFGNHISTKEVCKTLNTNAYHLYNMITTRVPRVHIENNEKSEIKY